MSSLKVNGLTYRTNEREVEELFERYGKIGEVFIPKDRFSRKSRGFAFVRFYEKRDADRALKAVDGKIFDGRKLTIERARNDGGGGGGGARMRSRSRDRRRSRSRSRRRRSRSGRRASPARGAAQGLAVETVKGGDRPVKVVGEGRPVKRDVGLLVKRGESLEAPGDSPRVRRTGMAEVNIPGVKKADMQRRIGEHAARLGSRGHEAARRRGWCVCIRRIPTTFDSRHNGTSDR